MGQHLFLLSNRSLHSFFGIFFNDWAYAEKSFDDVTIYSL